MPLSRDEFFRAAGVLPFVDVPVPELQEGASVRIGVMSGDGRDAWDLALSDRGNSLKGLRALLVALSAIDESGAPLFSQDDAAALGKTHGVVLERLYRASWALNKLGAQDVEDAAGN